MSSRINCHSAYVHYNMFHDNHCHGGGDIIGSVFNVYNNCSGGHANFWSGFGAGLGQGLGASLMGLFGGFMSNFSMMPPMINGFSSGFGMMPSMFNFWGGGGAGTINNNARDYSEYSSKHSCDCKSCDKDDTDNDDKVSNDDDNNPPSNPNDSILDFTIDSSSYKTGFTDCKDDDLAKLTSSNVKRAQDVVGQQADPPIRDVISDENCEILDSGKKIIIKDKALENEVTYNYIGKNSSGALVYKDEKSNQIYLLQKTGTDPNIEYHLMQYDSMHGSNIKAHSSS